MKYIIPILIYPFFLALVLLACNQPDQNLCDSTVGKVPCSSLAANATMMATKINECNHLKDEFHIKFGKEQTLYVFRTYLDNDMMSLSSIHWLKDTWSEHSCDTMLHEDPITEPVAKILVESELRMSCQRNAEIRRKINWTAVRKVVDRYEGHIDSMSADEKEIFTAVINESICKKLGE